jgi:hypothetical protein
MMRPKGKAGGGPARAKRAAIGPSAQADGVGQSGSAPASEVSEEFIDGMRNRMAMSFFKYGPVRDAYPHKISAIESLRKRLERYEETGNTEWLIDAANFAMIEFMCPSHRDAHFRATDAAESPGRAAYDTGFEATPKSNAELSDAEWRLLGRRK